MKEDIKLFNAIKEELDRERNNLEMIASENLQVPMFWMLLEVF